MILRKLSSLLFFLASPFLANADGRPNIILIMVDDMGWSDIGCYGGEVDTPNLDQLAAEGMRFTQFYNNAKCTTTRASIVTGIGSKEYRSLGIRTKSGAAKPMHASIAVRACLNLASRK